MAEVGFWDICTSLYGILCIPRSQIWTRTCYQSVNKHDWPGHRIWLWGLGVRFEGKFQQRIISHRTTWYPYPLDNCLCLRPNDLTRLHYLEILLDDSQMVGEFIRLSYFLGNCRHRFGSFCTENFVLKLCTPERSD